MWRFVLLTAICLVAFTACEGVAGVPAPSPSAPASKGVAGGVSVLSEDRALLVVQEYLLSKATSAKAKNYLAELYSSGGKWSAKSELLGDGTRIWNVMMETEDKADSEIKSQWRIACWTVFGDGGVLPSPKFDANALRIETELQELSGSS